MSGSVGAGVGAGAGVMVISSSCERTGAFSGVGARLTVAEAWLNGARVIATVGVEDRPKKKLAAPPGFDARLAVIIPLNNRKIARAHVSDNRGAIPRNN